MLGIEKIKCDCDNEAITAYVRIWKGDKVFEKAICRNCLGKMLKHPMINLFLQKLPEEVKNVLFD